MIDVLFIFEFLFRHMPITRDLFVYDEKELDVPSVSTFARWFKEDLEPFGGSFFFAVGQRWEHGPVEKTPEPSCHMCAPLDEDEVEYIVENSE
jgi:hypothetical protein